MASYSPKQNQGDGKASSFGRNLVQYIQNRLPYAQNEDDALNNKYKYFAKNGTQRAEALVKSSCIFN